MRTALAIIIALLAITAFGQISEAATEEIPTIAASTPDSLVSPTGLLDPRERPEEPADDLALQIGEDGGIVYVLSSMGIGTDSPERVLQVNNEIKLGPGSVATDDPRGIYWHTTSDYGIYRTPGAWTASTYQQLRIQFATGIQLGAGTGAGTGYDKSYVEVVNGKGLMITSGNVGIGTASPSQKLEIGGTSSQIYMNSATSNLLNFNSSGVAAPSFTTRSHGTKIVFYPSVSGSAVDYAMGIDGSTLWYSVPQNSSSYAHKFYAGTAEIMRIRGDGNVGIGTTDPGSYKLKVNGNTNITGQLFFDCPSCGDGGAGWGNLLIQGRVLSANSNIHLSPPAGYNVVINDTYRSGGGSGGGVAGLQVEGVTRSDQGFNVDGYTVIDDGAGWHRTWGNTGWYNSTYGSGIYATTSGEVATYNGSYFRITGGSNTSGNLRFDAPNPYIYASSYFVAPGGAYFNSGTVYFEAATQHRGGIQNDGSNYSGYVRIHDDLSVSGAYTDLSPASGWSQLWVGRHIDSKYTEPYWGGNTLFLGWGSSKVILGPAGGPGDGLGGPSTVLNYAEVAVKGDLGVANNAYIYWYAYAYNFYYWDTYDDLALLHSIEGDTVWDEDLGHYKIKARMDKLPKCITNYSDPKITENDRPWLNINNLLGLTVGAIRQLDNKTEDYFTKLEAENAVLRAEIDRLKALEARIEALESQR